MSLDCGGPRVGESLSTTIAIRWITAKKQSVQMGSAGRLTLVIVLGLIQWRCSAHGSFNVGDDAESALMGKCCSWCPFRGRLS
jgi:hypothetical protein